MSQSTPEAQRPSSEAAAVGAGKADRGLTVTFIGLWMTVFFTFFALGVVLPALPRFVRGPLHSGDFAVAVVITCSSIMAVISRPVAGYFAEARGRRMVMLTGTVLMTIGGILYLVPASIPSLVFARLLLGLGEACMFTAGTVWVILISPPERRGQLVGWYGVSQWSGLTLGPLAGALLLGAGYEPVWVTAAIAPALGVLVCAWLIDRRVPPATHGGKLLPAAVLRPGVSLSLAACGYATLAAFVILLLAQRHAGNGAIPFAVFAAAYVLTRFALGHLPDQLGPGRVALVSGIGEAFGLALIAVSQSQWMAIAGALIMGIGFSLVYPCLALLVINATKPGQQGSAVGALISFWDLGLGVGGPIVGWIATVAGYEAAFVAAAVCATASALNAFTAPGGRVTLRSKAAAASTSS